MKLKRLELDEEVIRDLSPQEMEGVSGGWVTGGVCYAAITISFAQCTTLPSINAGPNCGGGDHTGTTVGGDPTIGGETYTCNC